MGGIVSGVVNAAKSVWNSVKSFAYNCYQTVSHFVQNVGYAAYRAVNTVKQFVETKVSGNIVKVVSVAALVASSAINAVLGVFKLVLLVSGLLFLSIYLTAKIKFGPTKKSQKKEINPNVPSKESEVEQNEINQVNLNYENNAPDYDQELRQKAFDHSKEFLEHVKSFIQDIENFQGLDHYPRREYTYHFTLDGVKSIVKNKEDDKDEDLEEEEDENDNDNNEIDQENINENNDENNKGKKDNKKGEKKEEKKEENKEENKNEIINENNNKNKDKDKNNNDLNKKQDKKEDDNKNDKDDFNEKNNIKENVLVSIVWFEYNGHVFNLQFTNEISNEEIHRKIMKTHINNLKVFLKGEFDVKINEVEDENFIEDDIYKIDNITTLDITLTKNIY